MTDIEVILNVLRARSDELRDRFGVQRIGVFGSVARGEAAETSDLDILVVFKKPTFDCYMDLKFLLEDLFRRPVDLVTQASLKPRLREKILGEVRYAA